MATVYLFGMLYFLILVWDALRMRNTIQIIGLCLGNLSLMVFGAAEPKQVLDAINNDNLKLDDKDPTLYGRLIPVEAAIPCVLFVGTIVMSFVARKLYNEFAWSIYKHISADLRMKKRYMTYQVRNATRTPLIKRSCPLDLHCPDEIRLLFFPRLRHAATHCDHEPNRR